jgi:hypothetical protein
MKDLELNDILNRTRIPYTKLSVYLNGIWQFATLTNPIRVEDGQSFYRIIYKFGLTKNSETLPTNYTLEGSPGDYVAMDSTGELSLVKKDEYKRLFPVLNKKPKRMPDSSKKLKDPNYITKIVRGS